MIDEEEKKESCCCGADHKEHNHNEEHKCHCHDDDDDCGCGVDHKHHHHENHHEEEHECHCHDEEDEDDCGCGCGIDHKHHEHHEEGCSCGCGIDHKEHHHDANCGCGTEKKEESNKYMYIKLAIAFVTLLASYILSLESLNLFEGRPWLALLSPAWIAIIWCGAPIFVGAYKNLFHKKKVTSALLISIAIIASVVLEFVMVFVHTNEGADHGHSYLFAAGEIAFLMCIGEWLEDVTVKKARSGIEKLVNLAPKVALLKTSEGTKEVKVEDLKIGDIVVVRANEAISVDGVIVSGATSINEATINGESVPKDKKVGDDVFASTLNIAGLIEIKVTKAADDMMVNKLIRLTKEAESKKAPIAKIADKCASYIVPAAIGLAIIVFFVAKFAMDVSYISALIKCVTVLVVFCPCSLALATPTAIAAGLGNASRNGMLIKSGQALEALSKVKSMGFDKTGTLTQGEIKIDDVVSFDMDKDALLSFASSAESMSKHPIAVAITKASDDLLPITSSKDALGVGVESVVAGKNIKVSKWQSVGINDEKANTYLEKGKTIVGVIIENKCEGYIVLSDALRAESKHTIDSLNSFDIDTCMLTGDNKNTALAIGGELGLKEIKYSLMPDEKLKAIEEMKKKGLVAMVGDGANDAPALAISDVGIAMGVKGNDVAIETADIALMENDLSKIVEVVDLSKHTMRKIKFNIAFSMSINLIATVLSLLVTAFDPVVGALVHNCGSVFVSLNSAMLLRFKSKKNRK